MTRFFHVAPSLWARALGASALLAVTLAAQTAAKPASQNAPKPAPAAKTNADAPQPPSPAAGIARISSSSRIIPPLGGYQFPNGKVFNYNVEWRLFQAGSATLRMESAAQEQRVVATADAAGVVALLYHVRDRFEAFFDPRTYCSLSIFKRTEEGFRRLETNITFDRIRQKSVLEEKNLKNSSSKKEENDTPDCVTDVISSIYYIGSLPLEPKTVHQFPLNDGGKTVNVKVIVEAREEIKIPAGTFKTIRVQPSAESGVLKNRGQVWIWYSDDEQHIPVRMKARMFWGTLTFSLQSAPR